MPHLSRLAGQDTSDQPAATLARSPAAPAADSADASAPGQPSALPSAPPAPTRHGPGLLLRELVGWVSATAARALQGLGGRLLNLLAAYHDGYVAVAHHASWHIVCWRLLSRTVLRSAILADYEAQYDFAKRLGSLHASSRFLGSLDGGSFPSLVDRLKKAHGVKLVYCWHALTGYWSGLHPVTAGTSADSGLHGWLLLPPVATAPIAAHSTARTWRARPTTPALNTPLLACTRCTCHGVPHRFARGMRAWSAGQARVGLA